MATSGSYPPMSNNGKAFIMDPNMTRSSEVKASIKLKFVTPKEKEILVIKNFQILNKGGKLEFKRVEQLIKSFNASNELVTVNSTCENIDKQIPLLMHASKAILDNVIFCHQEETLWPFSDSSNLKKVFDEIFDTAKYTKCLEEIKEQTKKYNAKLKELKTQSEILKKDYDSFLRISTSIDTNNKQLEDINVAIERIRDVLDKTELEYQKHEELEKTLQSREINLSLCLGTIKAKEEQARSIIKSPEFIDYTYSDEVYYKYLDERKQYLDKEKSKQSRVLGLNRTRDEIREQIFKISNEFNRIKSTLDTVVLKEERTNRQKYEIITSLCTLSIYPLIRKEVEIGIGVTLSVDESMSVSYEGLSSLNLNELHNLISYNEEFLANKSTQIKKKSHDLIKKIGDASNNYEITRKLLLLKEEELSGLILKRNQLLTNYLDNEGIQKEVTEINSNLDEIYAKQTNLNIKLTSLEQRIRFLNSELDMLYKTENQKLLEKEGLKDISTLQKLEDSMSLFILKFQSFMSRAEEALNFSNNNCRTASIFNRVIFNSLEEVCSFYNLKSEEIAETKARIRDEKGKLETSLNIIETNVLRLEKQLNETKNKKIQVFDELKFDLIQDQVGMLGLDSARINSKNQINLIDFHQIKRLVADELDKVNSSLKNLDINEGILKYNLEQFKKSQNSCITCHKQLSSKEQKEIIQELSSNHDRLFHENTDLSNRRKCLESCYELLCSKDELYLNYKMIEKEEASLIQELETQLQDLKNVKKTKCQFENSSKEKSDEIESFKISLNIEVINMLLLEQQLLEKEKSDLFTHLQLSDTRQYDYKLCRSKYNDVLHTIISIKSKFTSLIKVLAEYDAKEKQLKDELNCISKEKNLCFEELSCLSREQRKLEQTKEQRLKLVEVDVKVLTDNIEKEIESKTRAKDELEGECYKLSTELNDLKLKEKEYLTLSSSTLSSLDLTIGVLGRNKMKIEILIDEVSNVSKHHKMLPNKYELEQEVARLAEIKSSKEEDLSKAEAELNLLTQTSEYGISSKDEHIYNCNSILRQIKIDLVSLKDQYNNLNQEINKCKLELASKREILVKMENYKTQHSIKIGQKMELSSSLNRLKTDIKNPVFLNIEQKYNKSKFEYIMCLETIRTTEEYYEILDKKLVKYHSRRMEEINKLINYYWSMTYQGKDIKTIEIRSDLEKANARSRSYNYRIVMTTGE